MVLLADNFNIRPSATARRFADSFNLFGLDALLLPPSGFTAAPAPGAAHCTWVAPSAPVDGYLVVATSGTATRSFDVAADLTDVWLTGLTDNAVWTLALSSTLGDVVSNAVTATVTPSTSAPASPPDAVLVNWSYAAPDPPVLTAVNPRSGGAFASWTPPAWPGGWPVAQYDVVASDAAGMTQVQTVPASVTSSSVSPLVDGQPYTVSVVAHTRIGESAPSNALAVTPDPAAPSPEPVPSDITGEASAAPPPPPAPSVVAFVPGTPFAPAFWVGR